MFWSRTDPFPRRPTHSSHMDLFDRFVHANPLPNSGAGFPAFNIWTDEDGAVLTSELPGVAIADLDITVTGRRITLKGRHCVTGYRTFEKI